MSLSMYAASVPVFARALTNLKSVLQKGATHAQGKKVSDEVMLSTRMIPDMLPLVKQVQIACDMVCRGTARLAGEAPKAFEDNETTFEQLDARLDNALAYINSFKPEQINGSETRSISLKTGGQERTFDGQTYLLHFVLPNLFFHSTTAYNILRVAGAPLGKADFLGAQ